METVPAGSVLAAFDTSQHSERSLRWAAAQALAERRPLDMVHVVDLAQVQAVAWGGFTSAAPHLLADIRASSRLALDDAHARVQADHPDLEVRCHLVDGEPRDVLVELSRRAHLLVLGSHGRGPVRSALLGSVSAAVARRADCPVVVMRPVGREQPTGGVVVGADGTAESMPVLEFAFTQASLHRMPLTVVHCVRDVIAAYVGDTGFADQDHLTEARLVLAESVAGLAEKHPEVAVTRRVEHGLLERVVNQGRPWELAVVGRHHHSAWHRLVLGSTMTTVLEYAHGPVAVVPEHAGAARHP